jgi:hypothetical protein
VKTFISRVAIAATILLVAGTGWFGLKRYKDAHATASKQPTDGSINGGVYTNNFFQFTVQFPAGWIVLSTGSGPQANAKATSYVLLLVGSPDSQMHGTRWIAISAARPLASSPPFGVTAEDVAKREADALKAEIAMAPNLGKKFRPAGEPFEISIARKHLARLDLIGQVNTQGKDYDAVSSQLFIIERGYLVLFNFTDPEGQESDREASRKAMDSLNFFGNSD